MATLNTLNTDLTLSIVDRAARMPAWFEVAPQARPQAGGASAVSSDTDWDWLEATDCGLEVIEHQVPVELLAAFFGKSASAQLRA
jgi:hypothetical protein